MVTVMLILAIYRLTRFVVVDEFPPVRVPRELLVAWLDPGPAHLVRYPRATRGRKDKPPRWGAFGASVAYLAECPWCMSLWVGAPAVWLTASVVSVPAPVLVWAAASAVTGLITTVESHAEQIYQVRAKRNG